MRQRVVFIETMCLAAFLSLAAFSAGCAPQPPTVQSGQTTQAVGDADDVVRVPPETLADDAGIARQVQANFKELSGFNLNLTPQPFQADLVFFLDRKDRKDVVFQHGEHDCPSGCLDHYYWYFSVWPDGKIEKVGAFQRVRGTNNQYVEEGTPMWGYPR